MWLNTSATVGTGFWIPSGLNPNPLIQRGWTVWYSGSILEQGELNPNISIQIEWIVLSQGNILDRKTMYNMVHQGTMCNMVRQGTMCNMALGISSGMITMYQPISLWMYTQILRKRSWPTSASDHIAMFISSFYFIIEQLLQTDIFDCISFIGIICFSLP